MTRPIAVRTADTTPTTMPAMSPPLRPPEPDDAEFPGSGVGVVDAVVDMVGKCKLQIGVERLVSITMPAEIDSERSECGSLFDMKI